MELSEDEKERNVEFDAKVNAHFAKAEKTRDDISKVVAEKKNDDAAEENSAPTVLLLPIVAVLAVGVAVTLWRAFRDQ